MVYLALLAAAALPVCRSFNTRPPAFSLASLPRSPAAHAPAGPSHWRPRARLLGGSAAERAGGSDFGSEASPVIHWYPGHVAKAEKLLVNCLKRVKKLGLRRSYS